MNFKIYLNAFNMYSIINWILQLSEILILEKLKNLFLTIISQIDISLMTKLLFNKCYSLFKLYMESCNRSHDIIYILLQYF